MNCVLYALNEAAFSCLNSAEIGTRKTDITLGLPICLVEIMDHKNAAFKRDKCKGIFD